MIKVAGILLCEVSVLFLTSYTQAKEYKKPNILFIMTDQQRSDMLSCVGNHNVNTPSLDRLSNNGVNGNRTFCR